MLGVTSTETPSAALPQPPTSSSGSEDVTMLRSRRRGGPPTVNGQAMNNEEWARQRKDNHVRSIFFPFRSHTDGH